MYMKNKIWVFILFVFSILVSFTAYFGWDFLSNMFCGVDSRSCLSNLDIFVESAFFVFSTLSVVLAPMFFLPKKYFLAWGRFAVWSVPLMIILLIHSFKESGFSGDFFISDAEIAAFTLPFLFTAISLGIIFWKWSSGVKIKKATRLFILFAIPVFLLFILDLFNFSWF